MELADVHFSSINNHTVDTFDGLQSGVFSFELDETISTALTVLISSDLEQFMKSRWIYRGTHLATQDGTEEGEDIVHGLGVDTFVQVVDEDITGP